MQCYDGLDTARCSLKADGCECLLHGIDEPLVDTLYDEDKKNGFLNRRHDSGEGFNNGQGECAPH